jgi:hypothetical protein
MAKFNESKIKKLLKEGRGQGTGEDNQPWVRISDYSSKGRASRILGIKTNRIHHLQSDNQLRAFLIYEFSSKTLVIRESYPLLDVMEVIDDKENHLRFDKFCDKETGEQLVICTNFLLTVKEPDGKEKLIARTVKNTSEFNKKITLEKLEIEKRYWMQKGIEWKIVTEKQLPKQIAKNIEWVRETLLEDGVADKEQLSHVLLTYLLNNMETPIKELLKAFDKSEEVVTGTGLYLFRYLIAKKDIRVNMTEKINLALQVKDILL